MSYSLAYEHVCLQSNYTSYCSVNICTYREYWIMRNAIILFLSSYTALIGQYRRYIILKFAPIGHSLSNSILIGTIYIYAYLSTESYVIIMRYHVCYPYGHILFSFLGFNILLLYNILNVCIVYFIRYIWSVLKFCS